MLNLILIAALTFTSTLAAADEQGSLQASQDYTDANTQGALDNRNSANHLFQSAHHHHHMAQASGNPGMMAQAMEEVAKAISADAQAQTMAKAALSGTQSVSRAQDQNPSANSNQAALQDIANNPSPYAAAAQAEFSGTPGVSIPEAPPGATVAMLPSATTATAPQPTATASGVAPAATGYAATAGPASLPTTASLARMPATANSATSSDKKSSDLQTTGGGASSAAPGAPIKSPSEERLDELTEHLAENMGQVRKEMGLSEDPSIRPKSDDIFLAVQKHYQGLSENGSFYGERLPADATPDPLDRIYPKKAEVAKPAIQEPKRKIGVFPSVD